MQMFLRRYLLAILFLLPASVAQAGVAVGDTPPDFLGKTRGGDSVLASDMHGKVVVIAFWASWCGYCQKELSVLAGIQKLISPEKLQVVAVDVDDHDTFLRLSRALPKIAPGLIYTFGQAPVSKSYAIKTIPRTWLIDRDGKVAYAHDGYDDDTLNDLANEINTLLAKPVQPAAAPSS
jgi:thiol-disulfide isomerase/thioredoxin